MFLPSLGLSDKPKADRSGQSATALLGLTLHAPPGNRDMLSDATNNGRF